MTTSLFDRVPDELVDMIFGHATVYEGSTDVEDGVTSTPDPFISNARWVEETRQALVLVNHRWKDIATRHLYRDIRLKPGHRTAPSHCQRRTKLLAARLSRILTLGDQKPNLVRTLEVQRETNMDVNSDISLCFILSHCTLSRFATSYDVSAPWLPTLANRSASTLTHLDIAINLYVVQSSTIEHLNSLSNLIWLRIREDSGLDWESETVSDTFDNLPPLSLPLLKELHLVVDIPVEDVHWEGHIPYHLGRTAVLPSLTKLRLAGQFTGDGPILSDCLHRFGAGLRELHVQSAELDDLHDVNTLAPSLTDLVCLPSGAWMEHDEFMIDGAYDYLFELPQLRRLTLMGDGIFYNTLKRIDPQKMPRLESVTLVGTKWTDSTGAPTEVNDRWPNSHDKPQDVRAAAELAAKGIPVYDQNGKTFGGLELKRVVDGLNAAAG